MPVVKQPHMIQHRGFDRKDNFAAIATKAAKATHMGRGEMALLTFYAACGNGFRPAAEHIAESIGVTEAYVYILRQALLSKGVIDVTSDAVVVNWPRIKILASLDPKLTSKEAWIKPQTPAVIDRVGKTMVIHPTFWELYNLPLARLIDMFGSMSNAEYSTWRRIFKKNQLA